MATESSSEVLGLVTQWLRKPCAIDEVMKVEGPAHRAWSQGVGYTRPWNQLLGRILAAEKSTWVGPFGRDHRIFLQRAHVEWVSCRQSRYQSTIRRMRRAIENRAPELFDRLGLVDWNQDFLDAESTSTDHWMSEADVMDDDLVESDDDLVESDDDPESRNTHTAVVEFIHRHRITWPFARSRWTFTYQGRLISGTWIGFAVVPLVGAILLHPVGMGDVVTTFEFQHIHDLVVTSSDIPERLNESNTP